jgi:hypothetical protein
MSARNAPPAAPGGQRFPPESSGQPVTRGGRQPAACAARVVTAVEVLQVDPPGGPLATRPKPRNSAKTDDDHECGDDVADAARPAASAELIKAVARYEVVVLEGCDGTGKSTIAASLGERHGYAVLHSGGPPSDDLAARYRSILDRPGKLALDRSFISELVYGPLRHRGSRLSAPDAADLAFRVADRDGVLVHLTGRPDVLAARLRARDGYAPPRARLSAIISSYRAIFSALADAAPILTADTTVVPPVIRREPCG